MDSMQDSGNTKANDLSPNRSGQIFTRDLRRRAGLFFFIFVLFWGCKIEPIYEFDEIPDLGIQTIEDAMRWVADEINYVSDSIHYPADEYWQSPAQTYIWRSGDCEDYVILALYLIHRDMKIDGEMVVGTYGSNGHAWIYVNGHYWEAQTAIIVDGNPNYRLIYIISYDEVIRRATTTHKSIIKEKEAADE